MVRLTRPALMFLVLLLDVCNTEGAPITIFHSFGGSSDGANPYGDLTLSGQTLYGMTSGGGSSGLGTIFALALPEPSPFALLGVGAIILLADAWRRWKRAV